MKHKFTTIIMALTGLGVALATHANAATVTYNFLENGSNLNLGTTSTFVEGGFSLTANGFLNNGTATALYAKFTSGDPSETGLGTNSDSDHEINTTNFVQLTLPTSPPSTFSMILLASVQQGEQARVYWSATSGILGTTLIGTITNADGSIDVSAYQTGYIGITAGAANILLESATFTTDRGTGEGVPDGGSTVSLLGFASLGLVALRRKLRC